MDSGNGLEALMADSSVHTRCTHTHTHTHTRTHAYIHARTHTLKSGVPVYIVDVHRSIYNSKPLILRDAQALKYTPTSVALWAPHLAPDYLCHAQGTRWRLSVRRSEREKCNRQISCVCVRM